MPAEEPAPPRPPAPVRPASRQRCPARACWYRWTVATTGGLETMVLLRCCWPVDDATGIVVNALFCEQENTRDYFLLMRGLIQRYGVPIALYTDRHSVFKNVPGPGRAGAPTQFSRAMDELGIQMVFALSPQAKGRVERTAGTFQDRLVTELRLAGAVTIEEANALLKEFLDRFNRSLRSAGTAP